MPKRKTKRKSRRQKSFSMLNATESLILANAGSRAFAGTNIIEFFTAGIINDHQPVDDVGNSSRAITLKELVTGFTTGNFGFSPGYMQGRSGNMAALGAAVRRNLSQNGWTSLATVVLTPVAFKVGKQLMRGPINATNRGLKAMKIKAIKV